MLKPAINQRANLPLMIEQAGQRHHEPDATDSPAKRRSLVGQLFGSPSPRTSRKRAPRAQAGSPELMFSQVSFSVGNGRKRFLTLMIADPATALESAKRQLAATYGGIAGVVVTTHGVEVITENKLRTRLRPGRTIAAMLPADDRQAYQEIVAARQHAKTRQQTERDNKRGARIRDTIFGND
jgi:hypothetical protein